MPQIAVRPLAQLCRRLSTSLGAGIEMRSIWEREAQRGVPRQRNQAELIGARIRQGETLAAALRAGNGYYPPLVCEMVDVGEQSGHLDAVLLHLADYYDQVHEARRSFLRKISWPVFQLVIGIGIVAFLILILGMLGSKADVLGLGLGTGASLALYFLGIFCMFGCAALMVVAIRQNWLGDLPLRIASSVPVLSSVVKNTALSRFSMSLGMALDAGMDVRQAVRLSLSSTQSPLFIDAGGQLADQVQAGNQLHDALRATALFPDEYLEMFETGELTGQLPEVLSQLANDYQQRSQGALKTLVAVTSVLIWVMIGALLIFVIIRLFITLYISPIRDALEPL